MGSSSDRRRPNRILVCHASFGRSNSQRKMKHHRHHTSQRSNRSPVLRHSEQAAVAAALFVMLLSLGVYMLRLHREQGRFIDIDHAEPLTLSFEVDVNTAPWPELAQLPEIGETLARRIVELRETDGPFIDHSDLLRVRGIGPRTLERIQPYLMPMPDASNVAAQGMPAAAIE